MYKFIQYRKIGVLKNVSGKQNLLPTQKTTPQG